MTETQQETQEPEIPKYHVETGLPLAVAIVGMITGIGFMVTAQIAGELGSKLLYDTLFAVGMAVNLVGTPVIALAVALMVRVSGRAYRGGETVLRWMAE